MQAPNIWLRDPVLYRIRHAAHHHTGAAWCIYPTYDFAHGQSDYLEGITHSLCTLEFEVHRPLYEWVLEALELPRALPRQIEFARLNLTYTVMSKRKLKQLVEEGFVERLGRSAPSDHLWHAPPRSDGERATRFRLPHRDYEISLAHRSRRARVRHARGIQQDGATPPRRPPSAQGRPDQLSRGKNAKSLKRRTTRRIRRPAHGKCLSAASFISTGPISWKRRSRNISGSNRAAKCV